jgi:hypothetical protein
MDPVLFGTMGAAIEDAVCFHAVANDAAAAMCAGGRQGMDGTFEAIKSV